MLSVEHAYSIGELTLSLCIILLIKALRLRISQIYSQDDISFVVLGSGKTLEHCDKETWSLLK